MNIRTILLEGSVGLHPQYFQDTFVLTRQCVLVGRRGVVGALASALRRAL